MLDLDLITQLLKQLISAQNPELGARLKQRLNALLDERGLARFDERKFGYKKFQDFLQHTQSDWLDIDKPGKAGDISVFMKGQTQTIPAQKENTHPPRAAAPIHSSIWQAFTNPDVNRKRFFHRDKALVRHFTYGETSQASQEVNEASDKFVQIIPIAGTQQQVWMRELLDSVPITGAERVAYDAILDEPYSSALNATFTRALGEHARAWREYRTKRITDYIFNWARANDISIEKLQVENNSNPQTSSQGATGGDIHLSARQQAIKLLEILSDEDISRLVIPILLSTIMVKSRL